MDNSADAPELTGRWAAPVAVVVVGWLAAAGALAWCLWATVDPAGRLLIGTAAAACAFAALYGTLARPRLAADVHGIRVRGLAGTTAHGWSAVESVRVVLTRRWGRPVPSLELDLRDVDGAERLRIFGRLDLGADPRDVADALTTLHPHVR